MFDDNNSSGNNGNKGKWSERLFKMKKDRLKKRENGILMEEDSTLKKIVNNILKIIFVIPSIVYTNVKDFNKEKNGTKDIKKSKNVETNDTVNGNTIDKNNFNNISKKTIDLYQMKSYADYDENLIENIVQNKKNYEEFRRNRFNIIKGIDISLLKKNRDFILKKGYYDSFKSSVDLVDIEIKKQKLQKEIIDLIKKRLVKNINELEILQSELYVLNKLDNGDIYLSECEQDIKEIKKMLSKVKVLKEKYDYLKNNVDFEYMLEYGDDYLVDRILELKDICSRSDIKHTVDDYKILDEYKFLYLKIDKFHEDLIKYEEYKVKKAAELNQRNIDFDKMKNHLYDVAIEQERYDDFVKKQEILLRNLNDNVNKIDSREIVTYKLRGFNQLLGNSFKYLGLLLVNPLKGIVPGIATQTLITKNMIKNLYNNLDWDEDRRMVYNAIDYSVSIKIAINDLDSISSLVDSTLEEILLLKSKYMNEFSQFESSFSDYKDVIGKLNKMENAILGNKIKIENMRNRMKERERENENKLKMVKKINSSSNN